MQSDVLAQVAWLGDAYVRGPVRGVILNFHGLGWNSLKTDLNAEELAWGQAGGLVVFPYYGPWAWMNRQARATINEIVDAVYASRGLRSAVPLICTGASMGGQGSLLYTRYAKRPVAACEALFPVCDLAYHFTERPELPMTIRHAYQGYAEDWADVIAEHSPLSQVPRMPDIPYLFSHGDKDALVAKAAHSDRMVAALRTRGLKVEYLEIPGMGHGTAVPLEVITRRIEFVTACLRG